jgi:CBS domain-containing protein
MRTAREILNKKGELIWSVPSDATVFEALQVMAEKDIGAVLVMDGGRIKGIFSERDYARKVELQSKLSKYTSVSEVMSDRIIFVMPSQSIEECMTIMTNKKIRHLPVFENTKLLGIISIGDVVNAILDEKDTVISELTRFIQGG